MGYLTPSDEQLEEFAEHPYQGVIWYWDRKRIRQASTAWSDARPRNN